MCPHSVLPSPRTNIPNIKEQSPRAQPHSKGDNKLSHSQEKDNTSATVGPIVDLLGIPKSVLTRLWGLATGRGLLAAV